MKKTFLMGANDWLLRSRAAADQPTYVSPKLRRNLTAAAIRKAYEFYSGFFEIPVGRTDFKTLSANYEHDYSKAISLGLFKKGGIREKDHLNFWCLSQIYSPDIYVESGVFIGSSLHAFISSPKIKKIFAIDPDLNKLRIPEKDIPGGELIDDKDFSELTFDLSGSRSLVYFDDHIDTARRIAQAHEKGFRYLLFDDSTGVEGICQRLYPAIPTLPMIMNAEMLNPGDELSWTVSGHPNGSVKAAIKSILVGKGAITAPRIKLPISQELIETCLRAKNLIRNCGMIPDLGEFVPPEYPARVMDTSKYLVELDQP